MSSAALSSVTRRHDLSADGPSSAVPESLLAELQSVSERVAKVVSEESHKLAPVSYTHLTLPTTAIV